MILGVVTRKPSIKQGFSERRAMFSLISLPPPCTTATRVSADGSAATAAAKAESLASSIARLPPIFTTTFFFFFSTSSVKKRESKSRKTFSAAVLYAASFCYIQGQKPRTGETVRKWNEV